MKRRLFVQFGVAAIAGAVAMRSSAQTTTVGKVVKSEAEWRKLLTPEQFHVLRESGTEWRFTSPLLKETRKGNYVCAGCDLVLFTSATKYDSGTGWPSFYDYVAGHLEMSKEGSPIFGQEYHCARCGGHHGHVFGDGPKPTGLRYCENGVAVKFVPA